MKKQKKTACPLCFPPNRLEGLPEGFIIGSLEQYCLAIISAGPQMIEQTGSMDTRKTRNASRPSRKLNLGKSSSLTPLVIETKGSASPFGKVKWRKLSPEIPPKEKSFLDVVSPCEIMDDVVNDGCKWQPLWLLQRTMAMCNVKQ